VMSAHEPAHSAASPDAAAAAAGSARSAERGLGGGTPVDSRLETAALPLGRLFGARSGDKGGNANLGVWARSDEAYTWLSKFLTLERLAELMPEAAGHRLERHDFANLRAVNFVLHGLLGEGVASSPRLDAQAKGLGEYLRSKVVEVPVALFETERRHE
ncbi:MAG: AtuA-related protein, partial [Acidimicrobiales bacterium]